MSFFFFFCGSVFQTAAQCLQGEEGCQNYTEVVHLNDNDDGFIFDISASVNFDLVQIFSLAFMLSHI